MGENSSGQRKISLLQNTPTKFAGYSDSDDSEEESDMGQDRQINGKGKRDSENSRNVRQKILTDFMPKLNLTNRFQALENQGTSSLSRHI